MLGECPHEGYPHGGTTVEESIQMVKYKNALNPSFITQAPILVSSLSIMRSLRLRIAALLSLSLSACSPALAQTTTYFSPGVPTSQPIAGNYNGVYRPQVHFSPPINFVRR